MNFKIFRKRKNKQFFFFLSKGMKKVDRRLNAWKLRFKNTNTTKTQNSKTKGSQRHQPSWVPSISQKLHRESQRSRDKYQEISKQQTVASSVPKRTNP